MTIRIMFKKFSRWLARFFDDMNGQPVEYDDHDVVIDECPFRITRGRRLDIHQLLVMEKQIYGEFPWDRQAFEIDLSRPNTMYLILIDRRTRTMVAFIGATFNFYARDVHISNLGVIPDYQFRGLGTFLLHEIERKANQENMRSLSLEVRRSNQVAQRVYRRQGFIKTDVRAHYYRDDGEDAFDMLKKLGCERK